MGQTPLLSVITATFNIVAADRVKTFREMVESVSALSYHIPVEHLIQDGGSKDGSIELYRESGDALNVVSVPDHGVYDAMNHAAERAQGKYLAFLNSDDYYHAPEVLAELISLMEKENVEYAFSAIRRVRKDGRIEIRPAKLYSIFQRMPYCHQSLIVRKNVFLALNGYDTKFRIVADHDFALRLYLENKSFLCGKDAFATFRSGGLSKDKTKNHQERAEIFRKHYSALFSADAQTWLQMAAGKKFPFSLFLKLLNQVRAEDKFSMARWYFCNLLRFL